jgi:hypothetical protein
MFVTWLLEDMLADLGCAVVGPAASVNEALAMIDAEAIDAAVLDVNFNGQISYPIADALAAGGVLFIFSTGYDKDALLDVYRTFPVLQKPLRKCRIKVRVDALQRELLIVSGDASTLPRPFDRQTTASGQRCRSARIRPPMIGTTRSRVSATFMELQNARVFWNEAGVRRVRIADFKARNS